MGRMQFKGGELAKAAPKTGRLEKIVQSGKKKGGKRKVVEEDYEQLLFRGKELGKKKKFGKNGED